MGNLQEVQQIFDMLFARYPALAECRADIWDAFEALRNCFESGGKLLACGNGGSAADCDHIVGELMKGFLKKRPIEPKLREQMGAFSDRLQCGLPAISLCAHAALISAVSNDLGGDVIYAQQVMGYGQPGDVLLGLSTSGNSDNVCKAIAAARAKGLITLGMTGHGGGTMREICDITICVPADATPDIQELHLPVYHALCAMVEAWAFGG